MKEFKVGEVVILQMCDEMMSHRFGVVLKLKSDSHLINVLSVSRYNQSIITDFNSSRMFKLSELENIKESVNEFANEKISSLKNKIKSVRRSDYENEINCKYKSIKKDIENTCRNLLECDTDLEFETKLKAIYQKKKDLFSIKCEETSIARKHNGAILASIKKIKNNTNRVIENDLNYELVKNFLV